MKTIPAFHTPANWEELMDWIEGCSRDSRPFLIVAAAMAYNLAVTESQSETGESND